jgi:hypothetical protein
MSVFEFKTVGLSCFIKRTPTKTPVSEDFYEFMKEQSPPALIRSISPRFPPEDISTYDSKLPTRHVVRINESHSPRRSPRGNFTMGEFPTFARTACLSNHIQHQIWPLSSGKQARLQSYHRIQTRACVDGEQKESNELFEHTCALAQPGRCWTFGGTLRNTPRDPSGRSY